MNPEAIVNAITLALTVASSVAKTYNDAKPFAQAIVETLHGKEVTQADLDKLEETINELSLSLQEELPPAQPGDPDYEGK